MQLRRLDMAQLVVFQELMRHRKLTVVADRLGLTQSAISHALKRLRATLDDELFLRRPAGVEPTARAIELDPRIAQILALSGELLQSRQPFDPEKAERLVRIGALDLEIALFAPALIRLVRKEAPGLKISFRNLTRRQAMDGLAAGDIDIALGYFQSLPESFDSIALLEESYLTAMRRRHPLAGRKLTLKSYCAAEHLLVSIDGDLHGTVDKALADMGSKRRVVASVPMFFPALTALASSDLIATLPSRLVRAHASRFGLASSSPPLPIRTFAMSAAWHRRVSSDPALTWLRERLVHVAND